MGRVAGHRGRNGELTVRDCGESVESWLVVRRVWVERDGVGRFYEVEHSRCYRDRWVLKLEGIHDGNAAAQLRGFHVLVAREDAPALPRGEHYVADLVGMAVVDERGILLGQVERLVETGGTDVLQVRTNDENGDGDGELLIPMAEEFVIRVDETERRVDVRLPAGLRGLNRGAR